MKRPRRPHVVVVVASRNATPEAAVLCSMLCDTHIHNNSNHNGQIVATSSPSVVRLVSECPEQFLLENTNRPIVWKCHETHQPQQQQGRWNTYMGAPDVVLPLARIHDAITGRSTLDDGAMATTIILCASGSTTNNPVSSLPSNDETTRSASDREILQLLASAIERIGRQENNNNTQCLHPIITICYTGSFRALNRSLSRDISWPQSSTLRTSFGAFAAPLRYSRIATKGLVLSVRRTCQQERFLVRCDNISPFQKTNSILWTAPLSWICPQQARSPIIYQLVVAAATGGRGGPRRVFPMSIARKHFQDAILLQLQDPSMLIVPCLFASEILSKQTFPDPGAAKIAVSLLISMTTEIYRLFTRVISSSSEISSSSPSSRPDDQPHQPTILWNDGLLADLVGSRTLVELTDNTDAQIMERISENSTRRVPAIRYLWLLKRYIFKTLHNEFLGMTTQSPFPKANGKKTVSSSLSSSSSSLRTFVDMSLAAEGLLPIITIGQCVGLNPKNDLTTIVRVFQLLKPYHQLSNYSSNNNNIDPSSSSSSSQRRGGGGFWLPSAYCAFHHLDDGRTYPILHSKL